MYYSKRALGMKDQTARNILKHTNTKTTVIEFYIHIINSKHNTHRTIKKSKNKN